MTQAEELLNGLTDEEMRIYTVKPETEEHIIIDDHRNITVPEPLKRIAVQFDHNVETVTFDCPRYWDEHDLSTMYIYVNYLRPDRNRGRCLAKNVRVNENDSNIIHFEWTIGNEITIVNGYLTFLVCALQTDSEGNEELHWNSEINDQMFVSTGLECTDAVINKHPDIINDLLFRMDTLIAANTPTLDTSLTQSGFAADAKITGDTLKTETTERQNADSVILNALNTETIARENADDELKFILNKKPYYFNNIAVMKASDLKSGDYVITNDGGGATYLIRTKTDLDKETIDKIIIINDDLVAEKIGNTYNQNSALGVNIWLKDENESLLKKRIDSYSIMGVKKIIIPLHFEGSNCELAETIDYITTACDYCLEKGITIDTLKIHCLVSSIDSDTNYQNKYRTNVLSIIQTLSELYPTIKRVTVFNERPKIYGRSATAENVSFANSLVNDIKNLGFECGITISNITGIFDMINYNPELANNLDFFSANQYPNPGFYGKHTSQQDVINRFNDYAELVKTIRILYPDKKMILSEIGVQDVWETLINPADWELEQTGTGTKGEIINLYFDGFVKSDLFKLLDEVWLWYTEYFHKYPDKLKVFYENEWGEE